MKISAILPVKLRQYLLNIHQTIVWSKAIKRFSDQLNRGNDIDKKTLKQLVYGWGNQGFSAKTGYLASCIKLAQEANGPILECGSGLTTIIIGLIAKKKGLEYMSLEHHSGWANKVQRVAERNEINRLSIKIAPLILYKEFEWYDISKIKFPKLISLVICDGPPAQTSGGRFGLVPVLGDYLASGTKILMDDMVREDEKKIIVKWSGLIDFKVEEVNTEDIHAIITLS